MPKHISLNQQVSESSAGLRLDQAAVELFPDFSRGRLQQWIKQGEPPDQPVYLQQAGVHLKK
jgi:23S rRNA pseudouridine1911/1915/1917 synthase